MAWRGRAGLGSARRGNARQGKEVTHNNKIWAGPGKARHGKSRRGGARQGYQKNMESKPMNQEPKANDYQSLIIAIIRGLKFTVSLLEKILRGEKV